MPHPTAHLAIPLLSAGTQSLVPHNHATLQNNPGQSPFTSISPSRILDKQRVGESISYAYI